jgi:uncharacterized protein (TIGR02246 family)
MAELAAVDPKLPLNACCFECKKERGNQLMKTMCDVARGVAKISLLIVLAFSAAAQERREIPSFRTYGDRPSDGDVTAIDDLIQTYKDSWAAQDTEAFIQLHAEDTEWINAYARLFQDAASLGTFVEQRLFPNFDSAVSRQEIVNMKPVSIRYLGDDAAVVHMYTDGARGASRNEGEELRRTHIHLVLAKQRSSWKIVHTAIMDAR